MEYVSDVAAQTAYVANTYHGEVSFSGGKTYHVFKDSGIFQVKSGKSGNIEVLVVAAGGGGGGHSGGGGGGGGIQYDSSYAVSAGSYDITVGLGGMGVRNVYPYGYSGGNSVFGSLTAIGGGGGSSRDSGQPGQNGGCGGGASSEVATGGTGSQGYNGGSGYNSSPYCAGGGGGGGAVGQNGSSSKPGDGGVGVYYSGYDGIAGYPSGYFSGGGGGGVLDGGTGSTGGDGGGGNGVIDSNGTAGIDNTGGGGGGGDRDKNGGNGGSGIVIISYDTDDDIGVIDNIDIASESQIISEGSYSLKIVAPLSYSENEYIFKTNTSPFDLSGYSYIIGMIRSDRTGSNIKLSFRQATELITPSGGTATADSQFNSSFAPSYGCDGDSSTRWVSTNTAFPHWWKYDFGSGITKSIKRIGILKYSDPDGTQIKDFTVQGSNNDVDYYTLYNGIAEKCVVSDIAYTWEYFSFSNSNSYRYYKIIFNSSYRAIDRGSCFWDIQMSESEYIYHEITPNITAADTWQTIQFDISAVSDANKDAIDQIIITVVNADADNTFYLDNLFSVTESDRNLSVSKVNAYSVLTIPEALNVSKANIYSVLSEIAGNTTLSKSVGYSVLSDIVANTQISKSVGYVVLKDFTVNGIGHLDPELGSDLNTGESWHSAWRTITGGPTSSRIPSGNCLVKIAKSPDPVSIGQAEWCNSLADTTDRALQNDYYTQLLLLFDEAHNSSYTIDSSHRNQTVSCNNLLVTNAQYKLNSTSGYFNGSSTYISVPDTEFLNFGTDDWTIDFWFRGTTSVPGAYPQIIGTQAGWDNGAISLRWDHDGYESKIVFFYNTDGTTYYALSNLLNFNQWYHVYVLRLKSYIYLYIDGVLHATSNCGTSKTFDFCYGGYCRIGGGNWDGSNSYYLGYLSDLRISRKIIRWTSNFTSPTSPYSSISIPKIILQTAQNVTIDNCESNWTQSTDVITSIRTDLYNQSYGALSVILGSNFTTGKIAYKTLSSQLDLSSYQKISFFYHVSANHAANIFKLCLCSDQSGNTIIDTFILPAATDMSATIHLFPLTIDAGVSLGSNINSIALYAISDPGTPTLILDNIIACKSGNSLSLNSLVSKNTQSDQWCKILSIIDNTVYISNYYGSNETTDTYQRQTYYTETTTDNYIQASGANGNLINYQAGYNKSTDEIDGETFYLGRTNSIGLHTNSKSNIRLRNLSFLNFGTGLYVSNSMNCDIEINNLAYNKTNYADQNSLYLNASHNNKISIKNLFYLSPNINIIDSSNNLINIKNTNLSITHSGYNNKIYASKYSESNIRQSNTFSNTKIYFQDFEIESQPENTLSSSTDNSKILSTRLYRDDSQNIITKYSGETTSQTSIRNTNSGFAWKLYLSNNTDALTPLKLSVLKLAVQANKLVTISCYFYANSPLITGALCCERWQLNGIDDDAIAYTTQLNTWEQLQITFTPTQDGVVEIKAYAFGSATYSVYVDDVNFTQASS